MEANIKSITVTDGIGREVNPYSPYDPIHEPNSDLSRFDYFAKHNVGYPCPELANTKAGETVDAELVWQERRFGEEWDNIDAPTNESQWTRQIYRLVPKEEKDKGFPLDAFNEIKRKFKNEDYDIEDVILRAYALGRSSLTQPTLK